MMSWYSQAVRSCRKRGLRDMVLHQRTPWQCLSTRSIQTWSGLSRREMAACEERIVTSVGSRVEDPILKAPLRSLGWLQNRITVSKDEPDSIALHLCLPSFLHPALEDLKNQVKNTAENIAQSIASEKGWDPSSAKVQLEVTAAQTFPVVARRVEEHSEILSTLGPGLANVAHFLAVYSCKGGVGKSTVAVNLAYELARMGGRVGLLDVDIYGPSLPVLIHPEDTAVRRSSLGRGMVLPLEHQGVKVMSLGFVSPESGVPGSGKDGGAAVMRGPMAGRVVTQLLKGTDWGSLDVLIMDLPPGTGDVQLTVCQDLEMSGAVAVTTPSKLASRDAKKGIEMFTSLGVPTLAVVENMAYFTCEGGGRHFPFGQGIEQLDFETPNVFKLPISTATNSANDDGIPLSLCRPDAATDELAVFGQLANAVSKELLLFQHGRSQTGSGGVSTPSTVAFEGSDVRFDVSSIQLSLSNAQEGFTVRLFSDTGATEIFLDASELRSRHPKTGEPLELDEESDPRQTDSGGMVQHHKHGETRSSKLLPATLSKKGRYGYSIEWADGATIIYSMLSIAKAAGGNIA